MKYPISYDYQGEEKKIILAITHNNQLFSKFPQNNTKINREIWKCH
jgi:hypothetical protein